jgi:hypothetical protein
LTPLYIKHSVNPNFQTHSDAAFTSIILNFDCFSLSQSMSDHDLEILIEDEDGDDLRIQSLLAERWQGDGDDHNDLLTQPTNDFCGKNDSLPQPFQPLPPVVAPISKQGGFRGLPPASLGMPAATLSTRDAPVVAATAGGGGGGGGPCGIPPANSGVGNNSGRSEAAKVVTSTAAISTRGGGEEEEDASMINDDDDDDEGSEDGDGSSSVVSEVSSASAASSWWKKGVAEDRSEKATPTPSEDGSLRAQLDRGLGFDQETLDAVRTSSFSKKGRESKRERKRNVVSNIEGGKGEWVRVVRKKNIYECVYDDETVLMAMTMVIDSCPHLSRCLQVDLAFQSSYEPVEHLVRFGPGSLGISFSSFMVRVLALLGQISLNDLSVLLADAHSFSRVNWIFQTGRACAS